MYRRIVSIIVILTFMVGIFGCATIEEHPGAATGAGIGAVAGATTGALLGHKGAKTEMAVLGGLLGALAGGIIGHYAYDQRRTKEQTAQKYNYSSAQGMMVRIEEASVFPNTVSGGGTVEINMTYAVLGSSSGGTGITETREIRYNGELYGRPQVNVTRGDGTYSSKLPITLPSDAKRGRYSVIVTVQSPVASDSKEVSFFVR